jgi:microcompartment protein CcmL/EutN
MLLFNKSIGIIETESISGALVAAEEILKEKQLRIIRKILLGEGITALIIEGELGALQKVIKKGADLIKNSGKFRNAHVIPLPHQNLLTTFNIKD